MSPDFHERARRLIDQERVEGLAAGDREWLGLHLKNCAECARMAVATDGALRSLRVL